MQHLVTSAVLVQGEDGSETGDPSPFRCPVDRPVSALHQATSSGREDRIAEVAKTMQDFISTSILVEAKDGPRAEIPSLQRHAVEHTIARLNQLTRTKCSGPGIQVCQPIVISSLLIQPEHAAQIPQATLGHAVERAVENAFSQRDLGRTARDAMAKSEQERVIVSILVHAEDGAKREALELADGAVECSVTAFQQRACGLRKKWRI